MGLLSSLLIVFGCSTKTMNGQSPASQLPKKPLVTFDEQMALFSKLGFKLNPGIQISDVERWESKKAFEEPPYETLYVTLGQTIEREPWTPLTDKVWDFDTEAIEDHGSYVEILKNLERISRGELKFQNAQDFVDLEKGKAWISFRLRGKNYKWDLKVNDDWVDPTLFSKIVRLTESLRTKGKYTYFNTGGQNAVIGYETPESRAAIVKATGLKIEWLN